MIVAFHTLGCKVNQYETEAIRTSFVEKGYTVCDFHEKADIYVINTCTVTNMADKKSRQMINRAKKQNPKGLVVAVGCYAQKKNEALLEQLGIDLIIGNTKKNQVVAIVESFFEDHKKRFLVEDISLVEDYEPLWISDTSDNTRAYLKVQDGCNQFCAYCIIPYVRGRIRSKSYNGILEEVHALVESGYKEIVLTGIHLASYKDEEKTLIELMEGLDRIEGLKRIRLGSLEPNLIKEPFVKRMAKLKKICPHFHLSLQSGCDKTLRAMNRKYTTRDYKDGVSLLRRYFDNPAFTTDVIVGFPGESEEDFAITKQFVESIGFSDLHVFKYSIREGTKAATMKDQINGTVKENRSKSLMAIGEKMQKAYIHTWLNKKVSVLLEEEVVMDQVSYKVGHTDTYLKVFVKEVDVQNNTFVDVLLVDFKENHLYGQL